MIKRSVGRRPEDKCISKPMISEALLAQYKAGKLEATSEYQRMFLWFLGIVLMGIVFPFALNATIPDSLRNEPIEDKVGFTILFFGTAIASLGSISHNYQFKRFGDASFLTWGLSLGSMVLIPAMMFIVGNQLSSYGVPLVSAFATFMIYKMFTYERKSEKTIKANRQFDAKGLRYVLD